MASANLSAEQECSLCWKIHSDPVMMSCGHTFCRVCIDHKLDTQEVSGDYFCPACRKRFRSRPALQRNLPLPYIAQQYQEDSKVFCTYCLDSSVPAVKACLLCDAYLCDKHLTAHNTAPEHVLLDPTISLQSRKCSTHKELIKYYCTEDDACEAADILLDVNTAHNKLVILDDRKTVFWSHRNQKRPKTPERFEGYTQVLSSQGFSSGRHSWDVDVGGSGDWKVGVCYPSIDRKGEKSMIGRNEKSWCLDRNGNQYSVIHDKKELHLPVNISSNRVRVYLDYEAGRISFYDLCDPIRLLHTFITTFTEPLHAGLDVYEGCIKIGGKNWGM
ncbi:tripartite motif-containing protein 14-like [Mantella aurantiaca]